jgi:hypothetical protein
MRLRNIAKSAQVAIENGELVSRNVIGEEIEARVQVRGWPALVVAFGEDLVVSEFGVSNERLRQLIRAARINTWVKQVVHQAIRAAPPAALAPGRGEGGAARRVVPLRVVALHRTDGKGRLSAVEHTEEPSVHRPAVLAYQGAEDGES